MDVILCHTSRLVSHCGVQAFITRDPIRTLVPVNLYFPVGVGGYLFLATSRGLVASGSVVGGRDCKRGDGNDDCYGGIVHSMVWKTPEQIFRPIVLAPAPDRDVSGRFLFNSFFLDCLSGRSGFALLSVAFLEESAIHAGTNGDKTCD